MAAIQSIFTGKQGWGLTHDTQTHTGYPKSHLHRLHFVQHGFWFCGLRTQTLVHLTALDLSIFVHTYIYIYFFFFSFLTVTSMTNVNIIVQEWEKNQTLHM